MPNFSSANSRSNRRSKLVGIGKIRRSQIITTLGPGAIVELPQHTVVLNSADTWYSSDPERDLYTLHDPNLEQLLGVQAFCEPPSSQETGAFAASHDIRATRFPAYHFCPSCGALRPYWEFSGDGLTCRQQHGKVRIIPSRFVMICDHGHLDDFPYNWWVHNGRPEACPGRGHNLRLEFSDTSEGLDSIRVVCDDCGSSRSMAGALGTSGLKGYHCTGRRPWVRSDSGTDCHANPAGTLRTASNVYFPLTESALTIPPWSTNLQQYLDKCWSSICVTRRTLPEKLFVETALAMCSEYAKPGETFTPEELTEAIRVRDRSSAKEYGVESLRLDEYRVLCAGDYRSEDDLHFRTQQAEVASALREHVDALVLVQRLREVTALRGFTRLRGNGTVLQPLCRPSGWLPAVEMIGEGIFIRLREEAVRAWEECSQGRYQAMEMRVLENHGSLDLPAQFSPRFVLLHTLAHLLIRQLALESGYNAASIKERLYSSSSSEQPMAGILLYTASSDADGSLGGLVRRGQRDLFAQTLQNALDEAVWCSADPVCAESTAQGYEALNYAACHSCTLLPETSCEVSNCLLDRVAVVGSPMDRTAGYMGSLVSAW